MDKKEIIQAIKDALAKQREVLARAAEDARAEATHEDAKPENQYDTRGLEASYLAGAQAQRTAELDQTIATFEFLQIKTFSKEDPISVTALVELETDERRVFYFIVPSSGGLRIEVQGRSITLITPNTPLGRQLSGAKVGAYLEVRTPKGEREYEVISVW